MSFKNLFGFFTSNEEKTSGKIEIIYGNEILNLLKLQETFEFNSDNIEKISKLKELIKDIYSKLFYYILYGEFQIHNINEIIKEIDILVEKFNNLNSGLLENTEYKLFINETSFLIIDIKEIQDFKNRITSKRKYILSLPNDIDGFEGGPNNSIERKLLSYLININFLQFFLEGELLYQNTKSLTTIFISLYEKILNTKIDETLSDNIKILEDLVILNLFKISLYTKKNKFYYYHNGELKYFKPEKKIKVTYFKEYENLLKYTNGTKVNNLDFIEKIKIKFSEDKELSNIEYYILVQYYKDTDKSKEKLKLIYDKYRQLTLAEKIKSDSDDKMTKYLNLTYIANNYLSYLIEEFKNRGDILLVSEIDNFYNEILNISKIFSEENYKNYFTYYKYAYFKNIEYHISCNIKDFSYETLNGIADTAQKAGNKAFDILKNLNHHCFFDFNYNDYLISINFKSEQKHVYIHNIFIFPFNSDKAYKQINNEISSAKENLFEIKYKENFGNIEKKIENNKLEAMVIIGIFTGIVVYSIGTIQIFTIIEDLGSAVLFSGIFLSGLLFLIGGIFFKTFKNKHDKGLQLFIIALTILIFSFLGKYYYSGSGGTLNINKGNKIFEKLDIKVNQAKDLNDNLDKKIDELNKLNSDIKNNITELKKLKQ